MLRLVTCLVLCGVVAPAWGQAPNAAELIKTVDRDPPPHPRTARDKQQQQLLEIGYSKFLTEVGAAVNALADARDPAATRALVLAMYRTPELFVQIRRALVATGPTARDAVLAVLADKRGDIPDAVAKLVRDRKLDRYCGDKGDLPPAQCQPVAARDFYAAVVLGDFYDPAGVPALLAVLKKPAAPAYYFDEEAGPTQHTAVFDALRKIGAVSAKDAVLAMWRGKKDPGALTTRILAVAAYPFVTRDATGVDELGAIAADNGADDNLRIEAATAFARLSRSERDITILQGLAQKYFDAAAKKRTEADGKPKQDADKADAEYARAKAAGGKDDDLKVAKKKHRDAIAPYKALDAAAKAYKGYARMFQTHIARIAVALRCKDELACYARTLALPPDDAAKQLASYIADLKDWTADEKVGLLEGTIERSMIELAKAGAKAESFTEALLDSAKSDDRIIRQSILLALPKIAKLPCSSCETKLDLALQAGAGKASLGDLQVETQMVRNYFVSARKKK